MTPGTPAEPRSSRVADSGIPACAHSLRVAPRVHGRDPDESLLFASEHFSDGAARADPGQDHAEDVAEVIEAVLLGGGENVAGDLDSEHGGMAHHQRGDERGHGDRNTGDGKLGPPRPPGDQSDAEQEGTGPAALKRRLVVTAVEQENDRWTMP